MTHSEKHHLPEYKPASAEEPRPLSHCPNCRHFLKEGDVNQETRTVHCGNCNHIFSVDDDITFHEGAYSRPEMLMPEGLEVLKLRNELEVRVPWRRNQSKGNVTFTISFTVLWNLILLPFVAIAIATAEWQILGFTALHLIVGMFMLVRTFALFANTSLVTINRETLEVKSKPFPTLFPRDRKIHVRDIKQLYVTKYVAGKTNDKPHYAYALYALLANGKKLKLLRGMNLETQRYLEYEIESFLHLRDATVPGEHPK